MSVFLDFDDTVSLWKKIKKKYEDIFVRFILLSIIQWYQTNNIKS